MKKSLPGGMTVTFVLLGLIILLFIAVPLLRMVFGADPEILWDTVLSPVVMDSIGLTSMPVRFHRRGLSARRAPRLSAGAP
jgi:ABC-type sulfate transport system permease component